MTNLQHAVLFRLTEMKKRGAKTSNNHNNIFQKHIFHKMEIIKWKNTYFPLKPRSAGSFPEYALTK